MDGDEVTSADGRGEEGGGLPSLVLPSEAVWPDQDQFQSSLLH